MCSFSLVSATHYMQVNCTESYMSLGFFWKWFSSVSKAAFCTTRFPCRKNHCCASERGSRKSFWFCEGHQRSKQQINITKKASKHILRLSLERQDRWGLKSREDGQEGQDSATAQEEGRTDRTGQKGKTARTPEPLSYCHGTWTKKLNIAYWIIKVNFCGFFCMLLNTASSAAAQIPLWRRMLGSNLGMFATLALKARLSNHFS